MYYTLLHASVIIEGQKNEKT